MPVADNPYNPSSRPRAKLTQHGSAYRLYRARLDARTMQEYLSLVTIDTVFSSCLFVLLDSLLGMLGEIEHPDPEIQAYLRYNISAMGGGFFEDLDFKRKPTPLYWSIFEAMQVSYAVGSSQTEVLYRVAGNQVYIDDFITYDPTTIDIRTNKKGLLTEDESSPEGLLSGIWQHGGYEQYSPQTKLPLWKTVHLVHRPRYKNPYGTSGLIAPYRWHLYKEALLEMYLLALDNFGTPKVAITYPLYQTSESRLDPVSGQTRTLSTREAISEQLNSSGSTSNVILLPQVDKDLKPSIDLLSTANNPGTVFRDALLFADQEICRSFGIPAGFLTDLNARDGAAERQMEVFSRRLRSLNTMFVQPFTSQSFHRLVLIAFNRESAKIPPYFPLKASVRAEDRLSLTQVVAMATDKGYLNPQSAEDWLGVRQMLDFPERPQKPEDKSFVEGMLLIPRGSGDFLGEERDDAAQDGAKDKKASPSSQKTPPKRARVKGKGQPGRPAGTLVPQNNPR